MLLLIDKNPSSILSVFDFTQKVKPRFGYHFEIEQENKKAEYSLISAKKSLEYALNDIDIYSILESLRDANSKLRDWGYDLVSEYEELERQL